MQHEYLHHLRRSHATWRLLTAENAPLILSFFHRAFITSNRRAVGQSELVSSLEDYLFHLRENEPGVYPKAAKDYLEDWARGDMAYLSKRFPRESEEPEFDLTPASEKAIEWLRSLEQRQFVGTESRLQTIYQLLRELVQLTESDPEVRIAELQKEKERIEAEIDRLRLEGVAKYDATQVKERFLHIEDTARRLLSDFRQVEENFRKLDRAVREKIASSDKAKGALLDEIFGDQDAIQDSDQGKSFRAFWVYLMTSDRQQEMTDFVDRILALDPVRDLNPDDFLRKLRFHLLEAGDKVKHTASMLVEQLRRYLDDQLWIENKRIMGLIGGIERLAVAVNDDPPVDKAFTMLDEPSAGIEMPMSRGLYRPPAAVALQHVVAAAGIADFASDALYEQQYVDESRLRRNIQATLHETGQTTLRDLTEKFPLEQGLSEVVAYMNLAGHNEKALIDGDQSQTLQWNNREGVRTQATVPLVIFLR